MRRFFLGMHLIDLKIVEALHLHKDIHLCRRVVGWSPFVGAAMMALCSISACSPERTQSQAEKVYVCHRHQADDNAGGGGKALHPLQDMLQKKGGIICLPCLGNVAMG